MPKKSKKKKKRASAPRGVPRRKKGESLVAYHDRLAALIAEATKAGDKALSQSLQRKAGELARKHEDVARRPRNIDEPRVGPGSYPWYQCVEEQTKRAKGAPHHLPAAKARERANKICGRIRADSRKMYPTYWNIREGRHSFAGEKTAEMIDPIAEYDHSAGCSVTGGYVVRDPGLPEWSGVYLFGDYCTGVIWGTLQDAAGGWITRPLFESGVQISSFGEDAEGRIYLLDHRGTIFRLQPGE